VTRRRRRRAVVRPATIRPNIIIIIIAIIIIIILLRYVIKIGPNGPFSGQVLRRAVYVWRRSRRDVCRGSGGAVHETSIGTKQGRRSFRPTIYRCRVRDPRDSPRDPADDAGFYAAARAFIALCDQRIIRRRSRRRGRPRRGRGRRRRHRCCYCCCYCTDGLPLTGALTAR